MPLSHLPAAVSAWFHHLVGALDRRSAPRLFRLLLGALFARGRRTVTSWFRAAGIADATSAPPTTPCGPPDDAPKAWPTACSAASCCR